VHLDLTHLGEAKLRERLPFVLELGRIYANVDPVTEPIPIRPVVHYMMGGVDVDIEGTTDLPGLYAAGEVACVSLNGANRLGSNSLSECVVFGARSARHALQFARGTGDVDEARLRKRGFEEGERIAKLRARRGGERLSQLRRELNLAMERGCGVYREEASLQQCVREVAAIKARLPDLGLQDASTVFNTEVIAALELECMVDVAEALASAAAARKESRGAHTRKDYKTRDDQLHLHHSLVYRNPDGGLPRLDKCDVTLGRWEPVERKY